MLILDKNGDMVIVGAHEETMKIEERVFAAKKNDIQMGGVL